jgi:hypothetical protein
MFASPLLPRLLRSLAGALAGPRDARPAAAAVERPEHASDPARDLRAYLDTLGATPLRLATNGGERVAASRSTGGARLRGRSGPPPGRRDAPHAVEIVPLRRAG